MMPILAIGAIIIIGIILYRGYREIVNAEKDNNERWRELHAAEQALQDLKDSKKVANTDLDATELEEKISRIRDKISNKIRDKISNKTKKQNTK